MCCAKNAKFNANLRVEGPNFLLKMWAQFGTPLGNPENECDCTSEGRDGFIDLCLKFDKEAIFDALGGVSIDDSFVLKLTANLNDGTPIEGYDCMDIVRKLEKGKED